MSLADNRRNDDTRGPLPEPRCRLKRIEMGLGYPKSGCAQCGPILRIGWRCAENATETVETGPKPVEAGSNPVSLPYLSIIHGEDLFDLRAAVAASQAVLDLLPSMDVTASDHALTAIWHSRVKDARAAIARANATPGMAGIRERKP